MLGVGFFFFAALAFACFCAACLCVAFGDLSPMIRTLGSNIKRVNTDNYPKQKFSEFFRLFHYTFVQRSLLTIDRSAMAQPLRLLT